MKTLITSVVLSIFFSAISFAQPDTAFVQRVTTFPMKTSTFDLTYDSTKNIVDSSGFYFRVFTNNVYGVKKVLSLNDTNLVILKNSKSLKLKVNDIKSVKFYEGTKFLEGLGSGAVLGFVGILLLHSLGDDSSFSGLMTALGVGVVVAIPCALIGGIVGLFFEDSHLYDLSGLSQERKKTKLIRLFREHR